jgi:hypothetical protein
MGKPHEHADLIKAWAEGADIQVFGTCERIDVTTPAWNVDLSYRIKPEPRMLQYRVALCKTTPADGSLMLRFPTSYEAASSLEQASCFVRWMSNWMSFGSVEKFIDVRDC